METPPTPTPPAATTAPAATVPAAQPAMIGYADFTKLNLRVATVLECKVHPNADKLLVLQVDLGGEKRQICAGVRAFYTPEQLVGKQVVVLANLEPRTIRGDVSQGMALAATDGQTQKIVLLCPGEAVPAGSKVS